MSRRRQATRMLLLLAVELMAIFLLSELGLRGLSNRDHGLKRLLYMSGAGTRFDHAESLAELLGESVLGFIPNQQEGDFVLNPRSLRTIEYSDAKPPGTFRILALGDSFTDGSGGVPYASQWHVRLEQELDARAERDFEVLNLGIQGTGTAFHLRMWQLEGSMLESDLVVLAFFVGNDFSDVGPLVQDTSMVDSLSRSSYVIRLLRNLVRLRRASPESSNDAEIRVRPDGIPGGTAVPRKTPYDPMEPSFYVRAHQEIELERMMVCDSTRIEHFELCFERIADLLERFRDEVAAAGAEFVLMLIPDEFQVDAELRRSVLEAAGRQPEQFDFDAPQRRLQELCTRLGISCFDLLPALRERNQDERMYRLRNTHWNEEGNALAARMLLQFLTREGLVPLPR